MKNKEVLLYIISQFDNTNITSVMKLLYFSELAYHKETNNRITNYEYVRYRYGPYCKEISSDIVELIKDWKINIEEIESSRGTKTVYSISNDGAAEIWSIEKNDVIDGIIEDLWEYSATILWKMSYRTKPMENLGAKPDNKEWYEKVIDFSLA